MKLSFLTFILLLCNYAAATVSLQYSQRRCGLLLTIKQAQIFNDF